jgi:hypothetical protein
MDKGKKQEHFFNRGQKIFWVLFLLIALLTFLHLSDRLFDGKEIPRLIVDLETEDEEIEIEDEDEDEDEDTTSINEDKYLVWKWKDFNGDGHKIRFKYKVGYLNSSTKNREKSFDYGKLYSHDRVLISDLIDKIQSNIKKQELNYLGAIEYVCSSIQYIPYTYIKNGNEDCRCGYKDAPEENCIIGGCCDNVIPFAVYAPFEFVFKKTGDCDTRALLAYTFLKEMGFDVAVMVSKSQMHSVLGINLPNSTSYSTGKNNFGKKYVLWELTNPDWRLGYGVEGNDWIADLE